MKERDNRMGHRPWARCVELEIALSALINALDNYHASDSKLHQLYLESQWLLDNSIAGTLVFPSTWDLIVFDMVDEQPLSKHRVANFHAKQVVDALNNVMSDHQRTG
jgi:hypothetical protein